MDKETARISKQMEKVAAELLLLEARLESKGFLEKAKPELVASVRETVSEKKEMHRLLQLSLHKLTSTKLPLDESAQKKDDYDDDDDGGNSYN